MCLDDAVNEPRCTEMELSPQQAPPLSERPTNKLGPEAGR